MKKLIVMLTTLMSVNAFAFAPEINTAILNATVAPIGTDGLNWKVGDTADYSLNMGFMKGTMHSFVREITDTGIWAQQDISLGAFGDQKVEVLYDKESGQPLEVLVNGEKQTMPDNSQMEVVDAHGDKVTVPAGSFECLYVKLHDKKENKDTEAWINGDLVPLGGMLKTIAPSQMGKVTLELTSFKKN